MIKESIISQASIIVGSGQFSIGSETRLSKIRNLSDAFIDSVMEDIFLSVKWNFAIKNTNIVIGNIFGSHIFTDAGIEDCLKVVSIIPGNIEWYIDNKKLYFKGGKIERVFYYSDTILQEVLSFAFNKNLPSTYINLCAISLASQIAHSMYSDSVFTEGLKAQYLRKLEETKRIHYFECNIENSANF